MEKQIHFYTYPFQCLETFQLKKWKYRNQLPIVADHPCNYLFFLLIHFLLLASQSVSSEQWDGVIVTQSDYQSLQAIKHGFVDPKGFLSSWNDTGYGTCSGRWVGIKCAQGQVIVIQLPWRGLGGRISEKIGQLSALRKLSLHDNFIGGMIPTSLGFLPNLRGVQLFNNRFAGSIPPSIGNCLLLQTLDLSNNTLTGAIPPSIANSPRLLGLNLSFNALSGPIPFSLTRSTSLTLLNLSYNKLSGSIPFPLLQKFNSSSFVGNAQLCGYSISTPCSFPPPSESKPPSSSQNGRTPHGRRKLSTRNIILIAAAGALLVVLLVLCCIIFCCLMKRRRDTSSTEKKDGGQTTERTISSKAGEKGTPGETGSQVESGGGNAGGKLVHFDGQLMFTADDLLCATAEIMGKSPYGTVYKATLDDGSQVAVKRLREKMTKNKKEFEVQVNLIGKIRHPNLLSLRAYYLGPKGEKLLVFDFIPRGSLGSFLHARGPETPIDWPTRMNIIKGITRGLCYLHNNENLVHGNLTGGNNVLLDEQTNPIISDFGLSRLMTTACNSNVAATAASLGYQAPELAKLKKPNMKTDIYSLGVIMLELLTGKTPSEPTNGMDLPQWVASIVMEEWTIEVFDLELMKDASSSTGDELLNTLKLALHCVDPSPTARPDAQPVLQQLEEIRPETAAAASTSDETFQLVEQ